MSKSKMVGIVSAPPKIKEERKKKKEKMWRSFRKRKNNKIIIKILNE